MQQQFTTIIWDLDGTLMDSLQDLFLSVNHALRTFSMPERTLDEVRQFVGNGVRRLMLLSVPNGENNPLFEQVFAEFKTYYVQHCVDHTDLYPSMAETLHELNRVGVRMAIVSNKLQAGVTELYQQFFADTIEVAIGERPGIQRKPAPDMVHLALQELGVNAGGAVYIGDSDVDIATARNAGIPCISVLWGFRDREFLVAHGAEMMVSTPRELLQKLLPSTE